MFRYRGLCARSSSADRQTAVLVASITRRSFVDDDGKKRPGKREKTIGVGVGVGLALGAALGAAFGNVGLGVAFGLVVGAAVGAALARKGE